MTHKKSPAGEGGAIQQGTLSGFKNEHSASLAHPSLGVCPLGSFRAEHSRFCRLVIAPKPDDRADLDRLHALRMRAAFRALLAMSRRADLPDVIAVARRMSRVWTMARRLPNLPPPFQFSEADAVRMAQAAYAAREAT